MRVRTELRPDNGATVLHLTRTLWRETDDVRPYAEGGTYHLERLTTRVAERGRPRPTQALLSRTTVAATSWAISP